MESKEHLGGFYVIQAEDLDAALAWASKVTGAIKVPIEVRPFADFADEPRAWDAPRPDHQGDADAATEVDQAEVGRIFRQESGRSVAALIRVFGDIDVAEDAVQEAFAVALRKWPPMACRPTRRLDHHHRPPPCHRPPAPRGTRAELLSEVAVLSPGSDDPGMPQEVGPVPDDRLRLIFTCCHPALSTQARRRSPCACLAACRLSRSHAPSW